MLIIEVYIVHHVVASYTGTGWVSNLALTRLKSAIYPLYRQPLLSELSGGALETFAHTTRSRCSSPGACANGKRHRNGYIPTLILKKALSGAYESEMTKECIDHLFVQPQQAPPKVD